ncbi:hypothetical protein RCO48_15455 [Peribacillus frigoritolerans]|nr:hypothetical protein [Peribacillus frigoritolerans]
MEISGNQQILRNGRQSWQKHASFFEKLRKSLEQVNDSQLDEELVGGLARQILHNVYHIGQIVLIRKQQGTWPQKRE